MSGLWFRVALINFLIAACMGVLLRLAFAVELPWLDFRYFVHAHSHVAMLGWLYIALIFLLSRTFLSEEKISRPFYRTNLILTQIAVLGMMISFPLQGYSYWAIGFASAHAILSYLFCIRFLKDMQASGVTGLFLKASITFLILSTLALWAMPVIIANGYQGKAIYYMAVQFYLHFQFNGWFIFAGMALFLHQIESAGISFTKRYTKWFFQLLVLSCLLTFALAVAWSNPSALVFTINGFGVLLQLAALVLFIIFLRQIFPNLKQIASGWPLKLLTISLVCFITKILVQTAVVFPFIATISYTIRNYVIGFIHLILLGAMTLFILSEAIRKGYLLTRTQGLSQGLYFILIGFIGSEFILFMQGTLIWAEMGFLPLYYEALTFVSAFIPLGLILLLVSQWRKRQDLSY